MGDGYVAGGDPVLADVRRPGDDVAGLESRSKCYVVLDVSEDAVAGTDDAGAEPFLVGGAD